MASSAPRPSIADRSRRFAQHLACRLRRHRRMQVRLQKEPKSPRNQGERQQPKAVDAQRTSTEGNGLLVPGPARGSREPPIRYDNFDSFIMLSLTWVIDFPCPYRDSTDEGGADVRPGSTNESPAGR